MQFPHPIRRIRKAVSDVQETILRFAQFLAVIYDAITANTTAVKEAADTNTRLLRTIAIDIAQIQMAITYLKAAEEHKRKESGQRYKFEVIQ